MQRPCHLVVIDDERGIEALFNAFLEEDIMQDKLSLSFYDSAESFLDNYKKNQKIDLIICDINLGGMNGYQVLDRICQDTSGIDFYMISGYNTSDFVSKAMDKGAKGFLDKPFDLEVVKNLIESYYIR